MPAIKKCLGVDIGSYSVKVAEVSVADEKVKILQLFELPLELESSATPQDRRQKALELLVGLIKNKKILTKEAVFSLPGQTVFVRKIRLPKTTNERLRRIIDYEARQQIPFPLDQTQKEYQVFELEGEDEVEVILTAIKKDNINDYYDQVIGSTLKITNICITPLALFNFYSFDSAVSAKKKSENKKSPMEFLEKFLKGKKKKIQIENELPDESEYEGEFAFEEVNAYLNIGANNLDLTVLRQGKGHHLGFTRSVPLAGNEITRAIQNKLDLDSFEEAERIKIENTIALVSGYEDNDISDINIEASKAATTILDRILAEVRRSLDFYISQPDGMTVDKIVISGGQVYLPNIAEYFEEKLGIPVEIKQTFKNETTEIEEEKLQELSKYIIAIGLGITGVGLGKININFLPPDQKDIIEFKKKNYTMIAISSFLIMSVLISTMVGKEAARKYNEVSGEIEGKLAGAQQIIKSEQEAIAKRKVLKDKYVSISKAVKNRAYWLDFLLKIQEKKPPDVWLDQVTMFQDGKVIIVGRALTDDSMAFFSQNMNDLKDIIEKASIDDFSEITDEARPEKVIQFTINIQSKIPPSRFIEQQEEPVEGQPKP